MITRLDAQYNEGLNFCAFLLCQRATEAATSQ